MKTHCLKCGYEWDYNGNMKVYANCPSCRNKVKIGKVEDDINA